MAMYDNLLANVPTDLWIGGKWRKASDGARFDVIDPATENKIASVASASVEDAKAAIDAARLLSRTEGIIPALESAHAIAGLFERASRMSKDDLVILNLSGRGDKDMDTYSRLL